MSNRAPDWLRQAEADIEHAQSAMASTTTQNETQRIP